jgi:hypothetical protein
MGVMGGVRVMGLACAIVCVAITGCGFDAPGESEQGGVTDDSSVSGGDGLFPTDDGATHTDTHADGSVEAKIDTTPVDTTPSPDTTPPPDTCIGTGGPCSSPGHCTTGTIKCDGTCSAVDPATFGTPCTSPKLCSSSYACDGSCPDPATVGDACSKDGCSNGIVQCNLACALPPTAHSACVGLVCAAPIYADCFGTCPSKSPRSGATCITCDCGSGLITTESYDDCGVCPGCPTGCDEVSDAGLPDAHGGG